VGVRTKTEYDEKADAQRDHHQENLFGPLEKPKGNSLIVDQGEMKKLTEDREACAGREKILGEGFGELIRENHKAGQEEEGGVIYARRFFFSSSD